MPKARGAGDLYYRVAFDKRVETNDPDDDGSYRGGWVEQFQRRASYVHLRGGESVLASRLQGTHTQIIFVRCCSQTLTVGTDWRIRDARDGTEFNVLEAVATTDRMWVDFLCQRGGVSG